MSKRILAPLLLTAGLAACSGPTTIPPLYRAMPTWDTMVHATAQGPMPLEVVGRPFPGDADLQAIAAEAMSGQVWTRRFPFVPTAAGTRVIRVVLTFNPPVDTDGRRLCGGGATGGDARVRIEAVAAFCNGGEALSEVEGWVAGASGPNDPRFRGLLSQMTRDLFGNNDEVRQQRDGGDPVP